MIVDTTAYLWKVLTFRASGDQISGVLGIAAASGTVASLGIVEMIIFIAAMSVNLGFANLLPIPILDGGHLVFYAFEKLKGSPLSERTQEYAFRFGITLLLFLFVYALFNDVTGIDWRSVLKVQGGHDPCLNSSSISIRRFAPKHRRNSPQPRRRQRAAHELRSERRAGHQIAARSPNPLKGRRIGRLAVVARL